MDRLAKAGVMATLWRNGWACFSLPPLDAVSDFVEYYNATLDHYFYTGDAGEIAAIDAGKVGPGWARTGKGFRAVTAPGCPNDSGQTVVYRFNGIPGVGPNSHFFTRDRAECSLVDKSARWSLEGVPFVASAPKADGTCERLHSIYPSQMRVPLYRVWRPFGDSNHRFTTDRAVVRRWSRRAGSTRARRCVCCRTRSDHLAASSATLTAGLPGAAPNPRFVSIRRQPFVGCRGTMRQRSKSMASCTCVYIDARHLPCNIRRAPHAACRVPRPLDRRRGVRRRAARGRVRLRGRRPQGGRAREPGLQAAVAEVAQGAAVAELRPVPRHPLQAGEVAVARGEPAVRGPDVPPGPLLRPAGAAVAKSSAARRARSASIPTTSTTARTRSIRRRCAAWASRASACTSRSTIRSTRTRCWCSSARATSARSGSDQRYGLSARGLAVDTALASGEEFPRFVEFWIERPEPGAKELTLYGAARLEARHRRVPLRAAARAARR